MIEILADKEQQLDFEIQLEGANPEDVSAVFKIKFGKIEVGFPAEVTSNLIRVSIPKLKSILRSEFKKPVKGVAVLETIIDGCYKVPWKDRVQLHREVQIEAKIASTRTKSEPSIRAKVKTVSEPTNKRSKVNKLIDKLLD